MIRVLNIFKSYRIYISVLLICISTLMFAFTAYKNRSDIKIPYFRSIYENVIVNIEIPYSYKNFFAVYADKHIFFLRNETLPKNENDLYNFYAFVPKNKLENVQIIMNKSLADYLLPQIKSANIIIGNKYFYFDNKEINKFNKTEIEYRSIPSLLMDFPSEVRKINGSKYINYNGNLNAFVNIFLSFFYEYQLYIFPWTFLLFGIIILPRGKILSINNYVVLSIIFIIALMLRFNMYTEYAFWWDEMYTAIVSGNFFNPKFISIFADPANPPLFAALSKLWMGAFGLDIKYLRILPVLLGSCSILTLFALAKDRVNSKIALISSFVMAVSIFAIAYSQEYRSYSLSMCLTPLVVFLLFKILEKRSFDYYVLFIIISIIFLNNHLFAVVFLFINFLYGIWYILFHKLNQKEFLKFIGSHIIILLSFLPFIIITFWKDALFSNYNGWIAKTDINVIQSLINATLGGNFVLIFMTLLCFIFLIISYFYNDKINWYHNLGENNRSFIAYLIFFIFSFYFITITISFFRPIIINYYYIIVYPLVILLISAVLFTERKFHLINRFFIIVIIIFISNQKFNNFACVARAYQYLSTAANQSAEIYKDKYVLALIDPVEYGTFFINEHNVYWLGNYNGRNQNSRSVTDIVDYYAKNNMQKEIIICVFWSELTNKDKLALFSNNYKYKVDNIKVPYTDHKVTRIHLSN